ncbi:MAG: M55 family metallopeptidase [Clostridiales bacterium]|jgi:D-amino peptidase|nr:M55 family metallopeptidase [Clostridiales bacterium]
MKLLISADIEGTCGIADWDETAENRSVWYSYFKEQMSKEVSAACQGALDGGADYVRVKDAHHSARNINPALLPRGVQLHRGWSGSPFCMAAGVEEGFDALAFTGYHSPACGAGNPLSHTMETDIDEVLINGVRTSEFMIHAYAAAMKGVPSIFLSGDEALCELAQQFVPGITVFPVMQGIGKSTISMHPADAVEGIRSAMKTAVEKRGDDCLVKLPEHFTAEVKYVNHHRAFKLSFYPGASLFGERTVAFSSDDYMEVLRFFHFVL